MESLPTHLVLGATGQVGFELVQALQPDGRIVGLSRPEVDLERLETVRDVIRKHRPRVIWNAAAATAVDALEDDPDLAFRVNAIAPGVIAEEAKRADAVLVHFSTDYVFDGTKATPYLEDDTPSPLNVYGRSKLAGEEAVRAAEGRHLILRTSWVYSLRGRNFLGTMVRLGLTSDLVRVIDDQVGAPTSSRELALACIGMSRFFMSSDIRSGLYHITSTGSCSWFEFACAIRDGLTARGATWRAVLERCSTRAWGARAHRPANSRLSTTRTQTVFGVSLASWEEGLERVLDSGGNWTAKAGAPR